MAKKLPNEIEDPDKKDGEVSGEDESLHGLNSPDIDPETGKARNKACSSFKQAASISKRQYDTAMEGRLATSAVISDKYAGSPPYRGGYLKSSGQGWRSNYSTNPLAGIVDRSTPQLKDPIKEADSLTYSALPPHYEAANEKSQKFRQRTTRLVRSWSEWEDFIDSVSQDNYLFGNAAPGWIDDDWRPRAFRHDETFLPEGTGQHASGAQFIVYRQPILLHDFYKKVFDGGREIAEAAGYDWEGCVKAANEAGGLRGNTGNSESAFERVDAIREGGVGHTYEGETKIVWVFHLLVREYSGKVNLWTTAQKGGHAIRYQEGIHVMMEDTCTFFTLQSGNKRFYGSKGSGRMLCNMHIALDRNRNFNNDKAYVAGLPIFKCKSKDVNNVIMHFKSPFLVVTGDVDILQEQVTFDAQVAQFQDRNLVEQMEAIAGSFIPPEEQEAGTPSTKIADAERVKRQLAVKNGVLGRFFRQFGDLISAIQRKVYSPDNLKEALRIFNESKKKEQKGIKVIATKLWDWLKEIVEEPDEKLAPMGESKTSDPQAIEAIVDLLRDGLSIEEIAELALSPATNSIDEAPEEKDQRVSNLIAGVTQNPDLKGYFNHAKMAVRLAKIQGGEDIAEEFILKENPDPSDLAANQAGELQEWLVMMNGDPVHPAQFQNHRVRRAVLATKLHPILDTLMQAPTKELVQLATLAVPHYGEHLQMDKETTPDKLQGEIEAFQKMEEVVMQAQKMIEKLAEEAAKAGIPGGDPNQIPPPMPGGAQPPGNMQPNPDQEAEQAKLQMEHERTATGAFMDAQKVKLEHRKLDIKEKELAMKDSHHTHDAALSVAGDIAAQAAQAQQAGMDAAAHEQQALAEQAQAGSMVTAPPGAE